MMEGPIESSLENVAGHRALPPADVILPSTETETDVKWLRSIVTPSAISADPAQNLKYAPLEQRGDSEAGIRNERGIV